MLAGRAPATGGGEGDGKPDGDGDLRPGAPGWRQAVDDHYASLADALETMDPETRARFEDDYARTTGVLPGVIAKQLRAGLLSADPAGQAFAATRLDRLMDPDPDLIATIPENERARARAIAGFAGLGLPPARAVELAEEKLSQGILPSEDLIRGDDTAAGEKDTPGDGRAVDAGDGGEKRSGGDEPEPRAGPDDDTPEDGAPRGSGPDADVVPSARKLGTDGLSGVQKRRIADAKAEFDKLAGLQPGSSELKRAKEQLSRLQQRLTKTERLELVRQVIAEIPLRGLGGRGTDRLLADGQPNRPTGELRRPSFRSEFVENTLLGQLTLKPLGDAIAGLRGMAGLDPVNPFSGRILSKKEVQETNFLTLVGAGTAGAGRLARLARNIPAPRSLGNVKARKWYIQQLDAIPDALDGSRPLDVQAKLAHRLRNEARDTGRKAMKDQKKAKTQRPNRTFEEMIQTARDRGFEGDDIWRYIIEAAQRSNPVVDESLGVTRKK
ncbi:MAG: hypothetical protein IIC54_13175 [Proteobacteria bacterium]|nr:hypothetical protein [Pseudomonadota bacterium]